MRIEIDRIAASKFQFEHFERDYLIPEKPVIITDVCHPEMEQLTPGYIKSRFGDESRRTMGWFESELSSGDGQGDVQVPDIVTLVLNRENISLRERPMRIFMQPKGHVTLPHYDGNSVCGMNLQITGRKRWYIVSPNTPLATFPFMFVGLVPKSFRYCDAEYDYCEFDTEPGDLLFVPRYWFHEVHSLEEVNLNLNWVFSPVHPNRSSELGRRECELLKVRTVFKVLNRLFPDKYEEYAGKGREIIDRYIEEVSTYQMWRRIFIELSRIPRTLYLAKDIKSRVKEFAGNNFNVAYD